MTVSKLGDLAIEPIRIEDGEIPLLELIKAMSSSRIEVAVLESEKGDLAALHFDIAKELLAPRGPPLSAKLEAPAKSVFRSAPRAPKSKRLDELAEVLVARRTYRCRILVGGRRGRIAGYVPPNRLLGALMERIPPSELVRYALKWKFPTFYVNKTLKYAMMSMVEKTCSHAAVNSRSRFLGVASLLDALGEIAKPGVLRRVMEGNEGYYLETPVSSLPLDRSSVVSLGELEAEEACALLVEHSYLAILKDGNLCSFVCDRHLFEFAVERLVSRP